MTRRELRSVGADDVPADASLVEAQALLRAAGVSARGVRRAGTAGDVLAVDADARELDRVRGVVPDLRRIGFRFVALEIIPTARTRDRTSGRDRGNGGTR